MVCSQPLRMATPASTWARVTMGPWTTLMTLRFMSTITVHTSRMTTISTRGAAMRTRTTTRIALLVATMTMGTPTMVSTGMVRCGSDLQSTESARKQLHRRATPATRPGWLSYRVLSGVSDAVCGKLFFAVLFPILFSVCCFFVYKHIYIMFCM